MKFFLIPLIILSIFVIPAAFAESAPYILVQIIHRDSDGNLLTYLQSDKMTSIDVLALNFLLDHELSPKDLIYEQDDETLQVISRKFIQTFDSEDIYANSKLYVNMSGIEIKAVQFFHDGFRIVSGDTVTTVWHFARIV